MNGFDLLNPSIPFGDVVAEAIRWMQINWDVLFDVIKLILQGFYNVLTMVLTAPPYWVMILIFAAIAWLASSWKLALFTAIGFYLIRGFDQWNNAMSTLSLVSMAVLIALVLSIPLGILAAKVDWVSRIVKPILDLMQTMPAMVYLIPAITIFGIGQTPGALATVVFAMPPGVRLTELAIRQVDKELVEAGASFGASGWRILRQIQIPVAMPTIMAGINQVIMLALSMVVLAGMAGAGGLGGDVVASLSSLNVPLGIEAGLAVVIIAIYLDRVSSGAGTRRPRKAKAERTPAGAATDTPKDSTEDSMKENQK